MLMLVIKSVMKMKYQIPVIVMTKKITPPPIQPLILLIFSVQ